jgi:peptide chain release factor 2
MNDPHFWDDKEAATKIIEESNNLKKSVEKITDLNKNIDDYLEIVSLLMDSQDDEMQQKIEEDLSNIDQRLSSLTLDVMLNGTYDKNDALLEIHAGAGGTEACDWASMLMRMYFRWCDFKNYKYDIIDTQNGEEAGIKSTTILVKGFNAYGYLKSEKGIHRLVRISPFDANKRRHTSFASVEVIPQIENDINVEIKETDLKIDVYHSSGAGGQSVNTTDSAVRMTHIPTGIVVTCQNERSQIKNKEKALQILKSKIYEETMREQEEKAGVERRSKIGTGDRSEKIRTYNYPQNRVTDHRINLTVMQLDRIMTGRLDEIIEPLITEDLKRKLAGN